MQYWNVDDSIIGTGKFWNFFLGIDDDTLTIELKRINLTLEGSHIWNINKGKGPREIVRITPEHRRRGFKTVGTLVIDKSTGEKNTQRAPGCSPRSFRRSQIEAKGHYRCAQPAVLAGNRFHYRCLRVRLLTHIPDT